jgi:succinate dehydrogenase / fumarate reductase cytochrome b subunit
VTNGRASRSTVALKLTMAITGLVFIGYVLLHMYGNLMAFGGLETYDTYAHHLRTIGEPMLPHGGLLWVIRIVLLVSLVLHVYAAFTLWHRAGKARTHKYAVKRNTGSAFSSRTMRWGGITLLLFVIWHLIQFTLVKPRLGGPESAEAIKESPYLMLLNAFDPTMWWVTLIYLVALAALAMHLHHGVWSAAQTLGLTGTATARRRAKATGLAVALVISVGFALVPLSILVGIIDS